MNGYTRFSLTLEMSPGESSPPYEPSLWNHEKNDKQHHNGFVISRGTYHPATASTSTPKPISISRGISTTNVFVRKCLRRGA